MTMKTFEILKRRVKKKIIKLKKTVRTVILVSQLYFGLSNYKMQVKKNITALRAELSNKMKL